MPADSSPPTVTYRPIGVVRSPFTMPVGMPLQSVAAADVRGQIVLRPSSPPRSPTSTASPTCTSSPTCTGARPAA